jgi:hypothetical protein
VWSHFVLGMTLPLVCNPSSKRLVSFVLAWHHAIAILLFQLDQLFMALVPELVFLVQGVWPSSFQANQFLPDVSFDQIKLRHCHEPSLAR